MIFNLPTVYIPSVEPGTCLVEHYTDILAETEEKNISCHLLEEYVFSAWYCDFDKRR